ncbi:AbgT family transporter [Cytobacillus kochii]|uniref:AbgT family transporter n=1 Tax=Cytobacillus kochii TaxID=859143 RepID=UPI0020414D54|nr:AbgT family transporter [Cytobacillus kochii]MCM3323698.1 AbgT family transporter [Cytobacillus kochii]MCM3346121.1 AbgT family transporter [Cytobacillus kochii]
MSAIPKQQAPLPTKKKLTDRFLDSIERAGNKLPDPITLFVIMSGMILILSFLLAKIGVSATDPSSGEPIEVINLLNRAGIEQILTNMVSNFTSFAPLGLVLVTMLGVGVAEATGLIQLVMKKSVLSAPKKLILPVVLFTAIVGGVAADAAFIVFPPIAALIFMSVGRSPLVGLIATYAAVGGGFSANILLNSLDVLLAGITEQAAKMGDPNYIGNPTMNYYFLIASTFLLVGLATWVTVKFVEPRFSKYDGKVEAIAEITSAEKRGLKWAGITVFAYIVILLIAVIPENGWLRDAETGSFINSPFMSGIVPIMLFLFLLPAIAFGIGAKTIKSDKDVADKMFKSIADLAPFIVLAFVAAQMIAFFNWSNIGPILAIKGAELLQAMNFTGLPMLIGFIIICAFINLLIASASAKWALLATIFVPMFMYLGYSPAFTQMAYRIGDSITNPITPMLAYFAILLSFARKHDKSIGIGTLISALLPYSICFAIGWIILFSLWYLLGLPVGPGDSIFL